MPDTSIESAPIVMRWRDAGRHPPPEGADIEFAEGGKVWRFKPQKLVSLSNQPIDPVAEAKRRDAKQETQFTAHVIEVMKARYLDEFKAEADPDIRDLMESDETFSSARKRLPELLNADPASNASTDASLSIELETAIESDDDRLFSNTDGPEVAALRARIAELEAEREAQAAQQPIPDPLDLARAINARLLHKDDDLNPQAPSDWDMDGQGVVEAMPAVSNVPPEIAALLDEGETLTRDVRRKLTERLNVELAELKNLRGLAGEDLKREAEIEKLLGLFARLGEI